MMTAVKDQMTDSELLENIILGEVQLYETLIRRYNSILYRIGRSYRYNHQDTEDLMQETYISAFHCLGKFRQDSSFRTWITRIMLNHCYHKKRTKRYLNENPGNEINDNQVPIFNSEETLSDIIVNREFSHILEKTLEKIPEDYRMVFTLRELNGFSVSETAGALNITSSNVKVRLSRAKRMLRSEIEKMYSPEDIYEFNLVYCDRMVNRVMSEIINGRYQREN